MSLVVPSGAPALRAVPGTREGFWSRLAVHGDRPALLTPDGGLPRIVLSVYLLVLMLNTLAAGPDRIRVLRSLGVTFAAGFTAGAIKEAGA